ncbi:MAG: outer membrane beta-barrel protein [Bacteroidales bacterium]
MNKEIKLLVLLTLLVGISIPQITSAQGWGGKRSKPGLWDDWSVNLNAGLTSFFGDLSKFDSEIMEKLSKESGPAFSGIITKHINNKFGISGQLLYGNLQGENNLQVAFEASVIEYNISGSVDFINLFSPDNLSKFGIIAYGGVGQFIFQSQKIDYREESPSVVQQKTGTPEFVYFFGLGANYDIGDRFAVTLDFAMRQAQNDKLDDYKTKDDSFDYYFILKHGRYL